MARAGPGGEPEDHLHGREQEVLSGNAREPETGPTEILSKTSNCAFAVRWKDFLGRLSPSIRTNCRFKGTVSQSAHVQVINQKWSDFFEVCDL